MANILVTGANGQLGTALKRIGFTMLDDVFYTDLAELDITDQEAVRRFVQLHEIDTIINCAAYTAVDKAEDEPEKAALINTEAVANLATVAYDEDCLLRQCFTISITTIKTVTQTQAKPICLSKVDSFFSFTPSVLVFS